jgi:hypothetical protein
MISRVRTFHARKERRRRFRFVAYGQSAFTLTAGTATVTTHPFGDFPGA